ncbi:unnamed protein product [Lepeophtheirus salmonis]|uniref:(salmon louse) hypothetical protein n=1 Tax=Lepeophtheirus salmonis TaxID=72036 RepID=A0A817FEE0_LEPSM|nr:unnamed protein product [Lepeophtheirus salmonis]
MPREFQTEREPDKNDGLQVNNLAILHEKNLDIVLRPVTSEVEEGDTESNKNSIISGSTKSNGSLLEESRYDIPPKGHSVCYDRKDQISAQLLQNSMAYPETGIVFASSGGCSFKRQ